MHYPLVITETDTTIEKRAKQQIDKQQLTKFTAIMTMQLEIVLHFNTNCDKMNKKHYKFQLFEVLIGLMFIRIENEY